MSITTGPGEDALTLLAQVEGLLDKLHTAPLWQLGNTQTLELVKAATVVAAKVASVRLAAVREVDARGTATADGASSTAAWLQGHCLERPERPDAPSPWQGRSATVTSASGWTWPVG